MRRVVAAEKIGEIDDTIRFGCDRRRHDIVELRDVATHDPDLFAEVVVGGGAGVDVHAHDLFAARRQQRDEPAADKAGAAEDQSRHGSPSLETAGLPRPNLPPKGAEASASTLSASRRRGWGVGP